MECTCEKCGAPVDSADRFCIACGNALTAASKQQGSVVPRTESDAATSGRYRTLAIAGLIVAGVVVLGVGSYQTLQRDDRQTVGKVARPATLANRDSGQTTARVPPKPPPQPPSEGERLKARLTGKYHVGGLDIAGWEHWGGSLMGDSMSWSQYQRSDGAALVLIENYRPAAPGEFQATFRVLDVLFIARFEHGESVAFSCGRHGNLSGPPIFAIVRPDRNEESWTDVRNAWSISRPDGRLTAINTDGVACANESWGGD